MHQVDSSLIQLATSDIEKLNTQYQSRQKQKTAPDDNVSEQMLSTRRS